MIKISILFALLSISQSTFSAEGTADAKSGRMRCSISPIESNPFVTVTWNSSNKTRAIILRTNLLQGKRRDTKDDGRVFPRGTVLEDSKPQSQKVALTQQQWYNVAAVSITFLEEGDDTNIYTCRVQTGNVDAALFSTKLNNVRKNLAGSTNPECLSIAHRIDALSGQSRLPPPPGAGSAVQETDAVSGGRISSRQIALAGLIAEAEATKVCGVKK